jgi:phosphohistidine phosphatase
MNYIILLRHAKASEETSQINDFERPLTVNGIIKLKQVLDQLKKEAYSIDKIITSPSVRTVSTAVIAVNYLNISIANLELNNSHYMCKKATLLSTIKQMETTKDTVLLVGHNPMLQEMAYKWGVQNDVTIGKSNILVFEVQKNKIVFKKHLVPNLAKSMTKKI